LTDDESENDVESFVNTELEPLPTNNRPNILISTEEKLSEVIKYEVGLKSRIAKLRTNLNELEAEAPVVAAKIENLTRQLKEEEENASAIQIFRNILSGEGDILHYARFSARLLKIAGNVDNFRDFIKFFRHLNPDIIGKFCNI